MRLTKVSCMNMCMRKYSGFITARRKASIHVKPTGGLIWLGNMAECGNAGSAGSAVSEDSNSPINKSLQFGISPCKIRMDIEIIAIDNHTNMDKSFIDLKSSIFLACGLTFSH